MRAIALAIAMMRAPEQTQSDWSIQAVVQKQLGSFVRALAMMRAASEELHRSRSQSPLPAKKQLRKTARWTTLSAAVLVQSVAGLSYIFSLYSSTLKAKFHLPQTQLDLLGTLSNVGATVGLHMGMLTDRVGPRPVVALGACLGVAGWLPLWAALDGWRCPYAVLCVLHLLQGQMALTSVLRP